MKESGKKKIITTSGFCHFAILSFCHFTPSLFRLFVRQSGITPENALHLAFAF
jgi:hypothetical protein